MNLNDLNQLTAVAISRPAANTATLTSGWIDLQSYIGVVKILQEIGVVSGTNPTWDGKIQHSADGVSSDGDVSGATFAQVTASNSSLAIQVDTRAVHRYIRYVGTIGGTNTPTFNAAIEMIACQRRLGAL